MRQKKLIISTENKEWTLLLTCGLQAGTHCATIARVVKEMNLFRTKSLVLMLGRMNQEQILRSYQFVINADRIIE